MTNANFSHQAGLINPSAIRKVTQFGAGSVGSIVALILAKKGVRTLEVWDDDHVESHNCPVSLYSQKDIGRYKVDALQEIIHRLAGVEIVTHREKFVGQVPLRNTSVVCCIDGMDPPTGRSAVWQVVVANPATIDIFCDSRTGGHYFEVHAIDPKMQREAKTYATSLHPDELSAQLFCGQHGTIDTATDAAKVLSATLSRYWMTRQKQLLVAGRSDIFARVL